MVLHTYVLRVQYSCDVVLVFWFWREIVLDVSYVLSVQYSCAIVSVFWLWREIVLKMRTRFYKKILLHYFIWSDSQCVYLQDLTIFYSLSFYFVSFSCTPQIRKLKFNWEYYSRIYIGNHVKNANTGNHTLISWTILIGFLYFRETTR